MKRGENIYHRKDGRWEGRYIKGRRKDGKPYYGYVYAQSYREIREKLLPLKLSHRDKRSEEGVGFDGEFSVYLRSWLLSVEERLKPSTLGVYRRMGENHILPTLGKKPMNRLGQSDLQALECKLKAKNLSANMIHNVLRLLLSVLKKAAEEKYITRDILQEYQLPPAVKPKIPVLTNSEQNAVSAIAQKDKHGAATILALYTGMRLGEICALRWSDINLADGIIHINQTVQRLEALEGNSKTFLHFGSPKTLTSKRMIPIPQELLMYLKKLKETTKSDYVVACRGSFAEPRVVQYRFHEILRKAKVRHIHFHSLRHTYAVRCLELKMDVVTLSQLLGHASAKMTLDVYGDSLIEHKRQEVQALNGIWAAQIAA